MEKLNELVELAKKATGGEWNAFIATGGDGTFSIHTPQDSRKGDIVNWPGFDTAGCSKKQKKANAKYIAAANPATILTIAEAFRALEQRAEAAEEALETEYKWRDLALQFDGHRMQALSLLKMIVNDAPVEQYQNVRNFLNSPPLSGEDIMKERIAAIAGRPAPAVSMEELVPAKKSTDIDYAYYPLSKARREGYNECVDDILRNIKETK